MVSRSTSPRTRIVIWVFAVIAVFLVLSWSDEHYWDEFFYLYSARFHSPVSLVHYETASQMFPSGFFSEKLGHVLLLSGLTDVFREGEGALRAIQAAYTLLLLGAFAAAYGCLRELFGLQRARLATLVFIFSPLGVYLAGKALSEVPSLLFTTLGCWTFVRAFRPDSRSAPGTWLTLATVTVGAGTLCRITGIVSFGALGLALLAAGDERFERRRTLTRLIVVGVGAVALQAGAVALAGGSDLRFGSHVYNVVATHPAAQHVYAIAMFAQSFGLLLPLAWRARTEHETRVGVVWLAAAALPFLAGHEPRYYVPALVPFAIVVAVGLQEAGKILSRPRARSAAMALLAGLVLFNRLLLAPLMPFEVQESQILGFFRTLKARYPHGTYLIPWASDYSVLRFVFPNEPIVLTLSRTPESRYAQATGGTGPISEPDQWWVSRDRYLASRSDLSARPEPWLYLGWTYSPAALRIERVLSSVGLQKPPGIGDRQMHNHLAGSWVWHDSTLRLAPVDSLGQYHGFRIWQKSHPFSAPVPAP